FPLTSRTSFPSATPHLTPLRSSRALHSLQISTFGSTSMSPHARTAFSSPPAPDPLFPPQIQLLCPPLLLALLCPLCQAAISAPPPQTSHPSLGLMANFFQLRRSIAESRISVSSVLPQTTDMLSAPLLHPLVPVS
ncbi:hypothetical protein FRC20_000508, partial [Serendipita sp. 405]